MKYKLNTKLQIRWQSLEFKWTFNLIELTFMFVCLKINGYGGSYVESFDVIFGFDLKKKLKI